METFYRRNADFVEIIVRDGTGQKLEQFRCASQNKKEYNKVLMLLEEKYGFKPEIKAFKDAKKERKQKQIQVAADEDELEYNWLS